MFGYVSNIITLLLNAVLRYVFVMRLDETLLGINSTYTNILSVLSLAELGVGTAINFSLYAPVARGDREKIKAYMHFYKKAYRMIAFIVAAAGLILVPFLKYIIKNPVGIESTQDLINFYLIFLFNTVSSYFVAYKYSLSNAEQKNYIQANVITITKIITALVQTIVILTTSSFYGYLISASVIELAQKIFANIYLNYKYPYLKEKNMEKLTRDETTEIKKKTGALVCHKVGDVARLQTDSIIITGFINVAMSGKVDNYNLVISSVSNFVNIIFNSVISSFGNLIATESREKQYKMFCIYRFFASWIYGFSAVGFYILLTPLVRLWIGDKWILPGTVIAAILVDYYFKGERIVLSNYKTAAGVFEQDKYLPLVQGVVNLIISVVLVIKIGLLGVYIGTIISGLLANIIRPVIIYRVCFERKATGYFYDALRYIIVIVLAAICCVMCSNVFLKEVTIISFFIMAVIITVVFNGIFILFFGRTAEFRYLFAILRNKLNVVINRWIH